MAAITVAPCLRRRDPPVRGTVRLSTARSAWLSAFCGSKSRPCPSPQASAAGECPQANAAARGGRHSRTDERFIRNPTASLHHSKPPLFFQLRISFAISSACRGRQKSPILMSVILYSSILLQHTILSLSDHYPYHTIISHQQPPSKQYYIGRNPITREQIRAVSPHAYSF